MAARAVPQAAEALDPREEFIFIEDPQQRDASSLDEARTGLAKHKKKSKNEERGNGGAKARSSRYFDVDPRPQREAKEDGERVRTKGAAATAVSQPNVQDDGGRTSKDETKKTKTKKKHKKRDQDAALSAPLDAAANALQSSLSALLRVPRFSEESYFADFLGHARALHAKVQSLQLLRQINHRPLTIRHQILEAAASQIEAVATADTKDGRNACLQHETIAVLTSLFSLLAVEGSH